MATSDKVTTATAAAAAVMRRLAMLTGSSRPFPWRFMAGFAACAGFPARPIGFVLATGPRILRLAVRPRESGRQAAPLADWSNVHADPGAAQPRAASGAGPRH